ncbi:MAG: AAA family ATPase [Phenylobacterium sp.]|uniref:ATP-dependent nuclease n=1 Tax=Phenylobacterium sp. TaxID=1871053 RepID=UPI002736ACDE|nr:AAA family ATPase [Phenylobacterium sp.]MDP3745609.1 AAA family ATPase [Phenylobacterium sp.]
MTDEAEATPEPKLAPPSGLKFAAIRVSNFRGLAFVEVELDQVTVILGANNAGKSSFLDAICAAVGAQRRAFGKDDIHLAGGEVDVPRERKAIVDLLIRPTDDVGGVIAAFPQGSYWTELFATGISQDDDFADFVAIRATIAWSMASGEYRIERKFLRDWLEAANFANAEEKERVSAHQLEPIALHYIDAKRDMDEDLRTRASFWRRLTDDLGLEQEAVAEAERLLSDLNQQLVGGSAVLKHVGGHLSGLKGVLAGENATVDISPVARRLRDLSKGLDVSISGAGDLSFPLARHGMGTRSLASLLVFQAFASWRSEQAKQDHNLVHTFLALEEPEAHLHPHAQRSLYSQVQAMPAQVVVSTHSPYFASQAKIGQLRLFRKEGVESKVCRLDVSEISADEVRKLEQRIMLTRGDLLFSSGILLFEGETEECSLPVLAERHWGSSIHELGLSFVPVSGTDYFPFVWLAKSLGIPWFILSDAEEQPLKTLNKCLEKVGLGAHTDCDNVVTMELGNDFEAQLVADGYQTEIEAAFNELHQNADYITAHAAAQQGQPMKKGEGKKDFKGEGGRDLAILDAMRAQKTRMAVPIATHIASIKDNGRSPPKHVRLVFDAISTKLGWSTGTPTQ